MALSSSVKNELQKLLPQDFPNLGEPEEYYSTSIDSPGSYLFVSIGLLIFGLVALSGAIFLEAGNKDQTPIMRGVIGFFATLLLIGSGVTFYLSRRSWGSRFEVGTNWVLCKDGMILIKDGEPKPYRWKELDVWLDVIITEPIVLSHHTYKLHGGPKRKKLPIPPNRGIVKYDQKMMQSIQKKQVMFFEDFYMKIIDNGGSLELGVFEITKETLTAKFVDSSDESETWDWKEIAGFNYVYDRDGNCIRLQIKGKRSRYVEISKLMPNVWMFQTIVNKVCPKVGKTVKIPEKYLL